MPGWRPQASTAIWWAVGLCGVAALALPQTFLPSNHAGLRRFVTPELAPDTVVAQTFVMPADDVSGVTLMPVAIGPVSGYVRFELHDVTDGDQFVRVREVPAAALVSTSSYTLEFAPLDDSEGRRYRLDVMGLRSDPPRGVALVATKGVGYADGTLLFNERERWADLVFHTLAPAGRSSWTRLTSVPAGPWGVSRGYVILATLASYWILLGLILRMLWTARETPPATPPASAPR